MVSSRRISTLTAAAATAAVLAFPSLASAEVYCVDDTPGDLTNNNSIDPSCQTPVDTIGHALGTAQSTAGVADTVRIGAGSYSVPPQSYSGTGVNSVDIIGSGSGITTWTMQNSSGFTTGLDLDDPGTPILRDLTLSIPDDAEATTDIGMEISGDAALRRLAVSGPTTNNTVGLFIHGANLLDHVAIALNPSAPFDNTGVSTQGTPTIVDSTIDAQIGVSHSGTGQTVTIRRSTIDSGNWGIHADSGAIDVRSTLINLLGQAGAVAVIPTNFNNGTAPVDATVDGVTIVNGGTDSRGVWVIAASGASTDTVNNGETVTASVANTVINGITHPFDVEADTGEVANVTSSYSNYDPSGDISTNDADGINATGTESFTETNRTNLSPGFVNSGGGNYHLAAGSPLIDIGDPTAPPSGAVDIDGDPRALDGTLDCSAAARRDIGADELAPAVAVLDCTPPDTSISGKAKVRTRKKKTRVTWTLGSTEPGSRFQCSLDGAPFARAPRPSARSCDAEPTR
jgi:hypothetical protein